MPRYFFDICDGESYQDDVGAEFASFDLARREAIRFAGAYISDNPLVLDRTGELTVELADASRRPLIRLTVSEQALMG